MPTNEWEKLYRAAILEPEASKMEERIEVTESAMHARLDELSFNHGGTLEEYRAIADALTGWTFTERRCLMYDAIAESRAS